jgi:hypothetical protein
MAAVFTFNPCETAVKVAAIQIAMDDIYYIYGWTLPMDAPLIIVVECCNKESLLWI